MHSKKEIQWRFGCFKEIVREKACASYGADNACCSQPTRYKLRLYFAWPIAASIVDYNSATPQKTAESFCVKIFRAQSLLQTFRRHEKSNEFNRMENIAIENEEQKSKLI